MSSKGPEFNPAMDPVEPVAGFDVGRTSERAGLLKLLIWFAVIATLIFLAIKIYQPGVRDRSDPPLITAENTPFKIVPEDRGGAQTPDQDKEVFDVMAGDPPSTDVITLPPPEQPIERESPASNDAQTEVQPVPSETPDRTEPQNGPSTVTTPPAREPAPAPQPARTGSDWVVQIASLRSQAEADRTFAAVKQTHIGILAGFEPDIVRVDLEEKGIYYRARIAGFSDRSEASAICDRLKAAGQSCFVARR
jgi:cell division protein FtsN